MAYDPPWRRLSRSEQKPPAHVPASIEMMSAEKFRDMPLGGWAGEFISGSPEAGPPPPQRLPIPAPPWADQLERGDLDLAAALAPPEPSDRIDPHTAMKLAEGDWDPPAPDLGPPVVLEPLRYEPFPKPDWRLEEAERVEREREQATRESRERREAVLRELLEEDEQKYPRPRKAQS